MALTAYSIAGRRRIPGDAATLAPDLLATSPGTDGGLPRAVRLVPGHRLLCGGAAALAAVEHRRREHHGMGLRHAAALQPDRLLLPRRLPLDLRRDPPAPLHLGSGAGATCEIGVPFLVWTGIYWVFTMIVGGSWDQAGSLLWNYLRLRLLPALLRGRPAPALSGLPARSCGYLRASTHHVAVMVASLPVRPGRWRPTCTTRSTSAWSGDVTRVDRLGVALGPRPHHLPGAVRGGHPRRPALRPGPALRGAALVARSSRSASSWASWPRCGT